MSIFQIYIKLYTNNITETKYRLNGNCSIAMVHYANMKCNSFLRQQCTHCNSCILSYGKLPNSSLVALVYTETFHFPVTQSAKSRRLCEDTHLAKTSNTCMSISFGTPYLISHVFVFPLCIAFNSRVHPYPVKLE
jgi:hypothetical protein